MLSVVLMEEVLVNVSGIIPSVQRFQMWLLCSLRYHTSVLSLVDCSHVYCVLSDTNQMH